MEITWNRYKEIVGLEINDRKSFIYRGQSDSRWTLTTSLHRTKQLTSLEDFLYYFQNIIPEAQEQVEAWDGTRRDLSNPLEMSQFLAFMQHNGFPTPLLDWTFSPYIAAYFAFEGVNQFDPQSNEVAIYSFDQQAWFDTYNPINNFDDPTPHVTLLRPTFRGNHKQMLQQGVFWFTNCLDPESHILNNEKENLSFLHKYTISVKERPNIMRDLELMGITAMQLNPGIESVCKKAFESVKTRLGVGPTPFERAKVSDVALLKAMTKLTEAGTKNGKDDYINCSVCNVKLNPKNLNKHMSKQHASAL